MALFGCGSFCDYLLFQIPELKTRVKVVLDDDVRKAGRSIDGIPVVGPRELPDGIAAAFLCSTNWRALRRMRKTLRAGVEAVSLDTLLELDWSAAPNRAWLPARDSIYPINVPDIEFLPDQELILLDFPARTLAQLPVGLGYVHDALKREGIRFQTVDTDIIIYHRYHGDRLMDGVPEVCTPAGEPMPEDPWLPVHYQLWEKADFLDHFEESVAEIADKLIAARPKIVACSIQHASLCFAQRVIERMRQGLPDAVVLVGGMSCLQPGAARTIFPLADYTVVGEADLTLGPLVRAVLRGEKVADRPGVWSRYDSPHRTFAPGEIPRDLAPLGHPRFEWTDVGLYRNWNAHWLTPIVGSRGCGWSRCRFCGERFSWRPRPPKQVADDIEFFHRHGCDDFVFNESDLHWDPDLIEELCDEIVRRGLKIRMTAQLRCNGRVGKSYFRKLSNAGFGCLRFGIDGWSENARKIQRKGYTKQIVLDNLRDATEAGILTEANCVIGVPGETDEDVDESIEFLKQLKPYIGRVPFVNPLMLFRGSEFWEKPEDFHIVFHSDKEQLYRTYPVAIPESEWHSESPHIDAEVRCRRFRKFVTALHDLKVPTTAWTDFMTDQVTSSRGEAGSSVNPSSGPLEQPRPDAPTIERASLSPELVENLPVLRHCPLRRNVLCRSAVPVPRRSRRPAQPSQGRRSSRRNRRAGQNDHPRPPRSSRRAGLSRDAPRQRVLRRPRGRRQARPQGSAVRAAAARTASDAFRTAADTTACGPREGSVGGRVPTVLALAGAGPRGVRSPGVFGKAHGRAPASPPSGSVRRASVGLLQGVSL